MTENKNTPSPQANAIAAKKKDKIVSFLLNYALYIIIILIVLAVCIQHPRFLSYGNFITIVKQASTKGIMALGVAGMIVLTGTDLSAGRIIGLSAAVTGSLVQASNVAAKFYPGMKPVPIIVALFASILVAVVISLVNGFGVAYLKMHAFIISLGTQLIAYGLLLIYLGNQPTPMTPISGFTDAFRKITNGEIKLGGIHIPYLVIYFIICSVIMWVIWNKTTFGKNMFAVGGNMEAATVSGINVNRNIMLVYLIGGIMYGIAAFLETGRLSNADGNTGANYELDAISACVIGGVSFNGGVGTIPGVIVGTLILQLINFVLYYTNVNPYLQFVIKGLIIIIAVAIDVRKYIEKK